jgi:hypothetical protein
MHLNMDEHYRYALDRQHRLRADAAAHRLTRSTPATTRLARFLGLAKDCVDCAVTPRRPGDTAAEHI